MKILSLTCAGMRGVPDGSYSFTDSRSGAPLSVVLVTGGPASGKTSLLEVIAATKEAVGSYGVPLDPMRLVRPDASGARITATWVLTAAEREYAALEQAEHRITWEVGTGARRAEVEPGLRRLFAEFSCTPERGKLEYFPANRALAGSPHPAFGRPNPKAEARLRATRARDKYATVIDGVRELALEHATRAAAVLREDAVQRDPVPDVLEPFKQAVAAVLPDLQLSGFDLTVGGGLRFVRRTREEVGLDELSDSELQGVLFALAFRYFGLNGSLVLIDEPELHVHAAERVRFLEALAALGRDNQIIAATGAAELVNAAERGHVIDLSRRATARAAPENTAASERPPVPPSVRGAAEPPASPTPGPGTAELSTSSVPARVEHPAPQDVPSYLRPAPIGGAMPSAPVMFPPPLPPEEDEGHGTAMLPEGVVFGPTLPFVQPHPGAPSLRSAEPERREPPAPPRGEDDGHETVMLKDVAIFGPALPFVQPGASRSPATEALPAWSAGPPGKRLVRFDPQTGQPLPEPIWVDVPEPGKRER